MREYIRYFRGLFTSMSDNGRAGEASYSKNIRYQDGSLKPRYGMVSRRVHPSGFESARGLFACYAYAGGAEVAEYVSIEKRAGVVRPYASTVAWSESGITNSGSPVALEDVDHYGFTFNGFLYCIAPGAAKTLYKHQIGLNTSWTALQDTAYIPAPDDPAITVAVSAPGSMIWAAGGAFNYTSNDQLLVPFTETYSDGTVIVSAKDNRNGFQPGMGTTFECTFASPVDYSGGEYIAWQTTALDHLLNINDASYTPQLKIGGVWTNVTAYQVFSDGDKKNTAWVCYVRGLTLTAVQGIRFRFYSDEILTVGAIVKPAFSVSPIQIGGTYLESTVGTQRLWDSVLVGDGIKYGVRYTDGGVVRSAVVESTIVADQGWGFKPFSYAPRVGGKVTITAPAPGGVYTTLEVLRLETGGANWKIIGTAVAAPWGKVDTNREMDLSGLVTAPGTAGGAGPGVIPRFQTTGLLCGASYRGFVIYGFAGTVSNIKMSRVLTENFPDAGEELYDDSITYDVDDLSQPSDYTLSEKGDEPIRIIPTENVVYYFGRHGVYAQAGRYPVDMTPISQIPGANAPASARAVSIFYLNETQQGAAWLDKSGNVWFVIASPNFETDSGARVIELSSPIRDYLQRFLVDEQRVSHGVTDFSKARVEFSLHDQALRVSLGNREVVYRAESRVSGGRFWESYEWNLGSSGTVTINSCTDYTASPGDADSVARAGSNQAWAIPDNALVEDSQFATITLNDGGATSEFLRVTGAKPGYPIDPSAVTTDVTIRANITVDNDVPVTLDFFGLQGGANLIAPVVLTGSQIIEATVAALPSITTINASGLNIDMGVSTPGYRAGIYNPANWSVVVTPSAIQPGDVTPASGPDSTAFTITATWTGGGANPAFCPLKTNSALTATPNKTPCNGVVNHDNGLGGSSSGTVYHSGPVVFPDTPTIIGHNFDGEVSENIPCVAGVATKSVTLITSWVSGIGSVETSHDVNAEIFAPIPTVIKVDSIQAKVCYDLTQTSAGQPSFQCFTNGQDEAFIGLSSTGSALEMEFDAAQSVYIEGTSRDAGAVMPQAVFQSTTMKSARTERVTYLVPELLDRNQTVDIRIRTDKNPFVAAQRIGHSYKVPITARGLTQSIEISFDETLDGVESLSIDVTKLSDQRITR